MGSKQFLLGITIVLIGLFFAVKLTDFTKRLNSPVVGHVVSKVSCNFWDSDFFKLKRSIFGVKNDVLLPGVD